MTDTKVSTRSVPKLSMEEAAAVLVQMGIEKRTQFDKLNREKTRPPEIPYQPEIYYDAYESWPKFIESGRKELKQRGSNAEFHAAPSYLELKRLVHKKQISSKEQYLKFAKQGELGEQTPTNVEAFYASEFEGWLLFLYPKNNFLCYDDAKKLARTLGIKTSYEWIKLCRAGKRPQQLPAWPNTYYESFEGWNEFLCHDD
jgi:hypothetical protein